MRVLIQRVLALWVGPSIAGEDSRGCCDLSGTRRSHRLISSRSQSLDNHPESGQEVLPARARVGDLGESGDDQSRKATWRRWYLSHLLIRWGLDMRSRRKVAFQMKIGGAVGDMAGKFSGTDPAGSL